MSTSHGPGGAGSQPTEEELRAAYEAQLSQLRVEHIVIDNVVMLINLGMRRTGLQPGTESERDPAQVRLAIEAVRAQLPQLEAIAPTEAGQIRNALSQLQLAYVRIGGQPAGAGAPGAAAAGASAADSGPAPGSGPQPGAGPAPGFGAAPGAPPAPGRPGESEGEGDQASGPGPAQRSGRLWIPGQ